jgi:integrase
VIERRKAAAASPEASIFAPTRIETVNGLVLTIRQAMEAAEELELGPFSLRDLRRTVETHLSEMEVKKETRAHLLSHGLGGVQDTNYDKYDYMKEKRAALELWARRLVAAPPVEKVVPIRRKVKAPAS